MTFRTGLFNRTCWVIPDEIKYNKEPMNNYDNWLNTNNPYDLADEEERERLDLIKFLEDEFPEGFEEELEEYLDLNRLQDPRKHQR